MADGSGGYEAFLAFMDNQSSGPAGPAAPQNGSTEASKPSEDGYSYEEEQEREAMMKNYHHPMKQWFRHNPHLTDKYGAFPLFWQDLKNWAPYREVLKKFLRETEGGNGGGDASREAAVDKADASASSNGAPQDGQQTSAEGSGGADNSGEQQPKRRKKSRWGDAVEDTATPTAPVSGVAADDGNGEKKRKKSRWAPAGATPTTNLVSMLSQQQQQSVALRSRLEQINQKVMTVAVDAARIEKDPTRSPSPPPQYDNNGKRTNTREVRMRAALEKERQQIIEQMIKVNPLYRPPADYQRSKLTRKIYIPVNEYPSYNFIGLIIGPRGNTQKRMEKESNCKIAIRGKGSVKEGSKGKKVNSDENDDLHVLIIGEREEDLDRAAKEVRALLVPVDDMMNDHKQKQLRELALINGTLRDDDFCHLCGEKGHRQWECPNREKTFKAVDVRCSICGDSSHPTRDCTQRGKSAAETAEIDKEYQSFMQQLGEKPVISSSTTTTTAKPVAPAPAAAAPWLQPAKSALAATAQPWMKQATGAPGTSGGLAPPGTQPSGAPVLGSTPATAFPPPVAPSAAAYGAYPAQAQNWDQWNAYYYGQWDQSGAAVPAAEYQQYGHYGPPAGAAGATGAAGAGAAGAGAAQPGAATPADYSSYQYQSYQSHAPQ